MIHAPSISQVQRSIDSSYNGHSPIGIVEKTLRPASRSAPLIQSAESSASGAFFNELEERGEICLRLATRLSSASDASQRLKAGTTSQIDASTWCTRNCCKKQLRLICHDPPERLSKHPSVMFGEQKVIVSLDAVHTWYHTY